MFLYNGIEASYIYKFWLKTCILLIYTLYVAYNDMLPDLFCDYMILLCHYLRNLSSGLKMVYYRYAKNTLKKAKRNVWISKMLSELWHLIFTIESDV